MIGVVASAILVMYLLAPVIVHGFLGDKYIPAIPVFRVLLVSVLPIAVSGILGIQTMLPSGMDKQFNQITLVFGLTYLALTWKVAPSLGAYGMAWLTLLTEVGVVLAMVATLKVAGRNGHSNRPKGGDIATTD